MPEVTVTKTAPETPAFGRPRWMMPLGEGIFGVSPFALMREFVDEMNRSFTTPLASGNGTFWPAIECKRTNGTLIVTAEVPGLKKEEVKVELSGDSLILEGERKMEKKEEKEGWFQSERHYGKFYRAIPLPEGAQADQVKADLANGVLEVKVPIADVKPKSKAIPVTEAKK
ncbi:MAG: Hsp20/alpha crystallin family protein [Bryobacteraceae bacterium]